LRFSGCEKNEEGKIGVGSVNFACSIVSMEREMMIDVVGSCVCGDGFVYCDCWLEE